MIPFPKRAALVAALASIGAMVAPAAANATIAPPEVVANTLNVTSDDQGDTITLAAAGGVITVNGAATTLPANDNAVINVNGGGGDDVVDASALAATNYAALTLLGGEGDDLLTGGADADTLRGEGGTDRLIGFRGSTDVVFGGVGDDVMVWNNGDGTDVNDGDAGIDEVEVNGSPAAGDAFTYKADPATAGRVQFNRTNLITFGINFTAERLTVNGLGGDETAAPDPAAPGGIAALTSVTLNGGTGDDQLVGADGADLITGGGGFDTLVGADGADLVRGGDDADSLIGEGGDDRLVGDRGTDFHTGGIGDDALVWNNGDGTDNSAGDDGFDRVEVNGSATAGDVFSLAPDGDDAVFERTNLVPFAINLTSGPALLTEDPRGGVEAVVVNGLGGNDTFTVRPGLATLLVAADGGSGNDSLIGDEEADSFFGGSGDDGLEPGTGSDLADGEEGDDEVLARDGAGDLVRGGAGTDEATTDSVTVDAVSGVEALDATPLPAPSAGDNKALLPSLGKVGLKRRSGKLVARAPLTCPAAEEGGCRLTLTLVTAKRVKLGKVRAALVLGSKSARLGPGQRAVVPVRLIGGAAQLAKRGQISARARIASRDAAGNVATGSKVVALQIPGR